jgi:predicted aminopeptidase
MHFSTFSIRCLCLWLWLCCLSGCQTAKFYTQAVRGHLEIMQKSRPVAEVLLSADTPSPLKQRLALTGEMLDFATQKLGLPGEHQYRRYADLQREKVSWVVCATPEFSMEPKRWWYPLVGKLSYRGYFAESEAKAKAVELRSQGYDVLVSEVNAYSTLGYFHDPLLNTFIHEPEPFLAELLFHELTHQRLYIAGKTEFNEALATTVGQNGARLWLETRGQHALRLRYDAVLQAQAQLQVELGKTEAALTALYAQSTAWTLPRRREAKAAVFAKLRTACLQNPILRERKGVQKWLAQPLSNAHLALHQTYHALVPAMEAQLNACGGDFSVFLSKMEHQVP